MSTDSIQESFKVYPNIQQKHFVKMSNNISAPHPNYEFPTSSCWQGLGSVAPGAARGKVAKTKKIFPEPEKGKMQKCKSSQIPQIEF